MPLRALSDSGVAMGWAGWAKSRGPRVPGKNNCARR